MLKAKIGVLEERFKNLASSGQFLDSLSSFQAKASSSIPDYYIFEASGEVVNSAAVTRVQFMSKPRL